MACKSATFIVTTGLGAGWLAAASSSPALESPASEREEHVDGGTCAGAGAGWFWPRAWRVVKAIFDNIQRNGTVEM